jgi:hypothetical protein
LEIYTAALRCGDFRAETELLLFAMMKKGATVTRQAQFNDRGDRVIKNGKMEGKKENDNEQNLQ